MTSFVVLRFHCKYFPLLNQRIKAVTHIDVPLGTSFEASVVLVVVMAMAMMTVVVVVAVAVMVVTELEVRMEGCHLGIIISMMSGKALGVSGSNLERSQIFFL